MNLRYFRFCLFSLKNQRLTQLGYCAPFPLEDSKELLFIRSYPCRNDASLPTLTSVTTRRHRNVDARVWSLRKNVMIGSQAESGVCLCCQQQQQLLLQQHQQHGNTALRCSRMFFLQSLCVFQVTVYLAVPNKSD